MLIIVAGMPRSGSTLQSNISKSIVELKGVGKRVEWTKDWQKDLEHLSELAESELFYIQKAHIIDQNVIDYAESNPGRVFFLISYRDVRDVAVSMMEKFDYSFDKAVRRIEESVNNINKLRESSLAILEQPYGVLRYDLRGAIRQVAIFLDLKTEEHEVESIYNALNVDVAYDKSRKKKIRFEKIRRKISYFMGEHFQFADDELMLHSNHVSSWKGNNGIWKEVLTERQIDVIEERFLEWLD